MSETKGHTPLPEPLPCSCGRKVIVAPSYGGNTGNMTFYRVTCPCGRDEDDLGKDGTKRSATRMWNQLRRDEIAKADAATGEGAK